METVFNVPSISCSICANRIRSGLGGMEGIESVDINLKEQTVKVLYNPDIRQPGDIQSKIEEMGYEIVQ
ncbi:MAG: heavy-metal-associated domain-containing protein [Acetivibrionales bacterium]|jgi:copper chaperone CopZ